MSKKGKAAAFIDRDGTLIEEKHYLCDPEQVILCSGVIEGLRRLREADFLLFMVTNQSGIARGYFNVETMNAVHARLASLLAKENIVFDGIYYCPHAPDEDCDCRKPRPGMLEAACRDFLIDPSASVVIGDKACDVELGKTQGMKGILVQTGHGHRYSPDAIEPDFIGADLGMAVDWILDGSGFTAG